MRKITVIQKDYNGAGDDRRFTYWVKPGQVDLKVRSLERSFNMDHTDIEIG